MAKRIVITCDLCNNEFKEGTEFTTLTLKNSDETRGNKYDICVNCSCKMNLQLIGQTRILDKEWGFGVTLRPRKGLSETPTISTDLGPDDDFIASKLRERGNSKNNLTKINPPELEGGAKNCTHINKTVARLVGENFLQECRDCGAKFEPRKKENNV